MKAYIYALTCRTLSCPDKRGGEDGHSGARLRNITHWFQAAISRANEETLKNYADKARLTIRLREVKIRTARPKDFRRTRVNDRITPELCMNETVVTGRGTVF